VRKSVQRVADDAVWWGRWDVRVERISLTLVQMPILSLLLPACLNMSLNGLQKDCTLAVDVFTKEPELEVKSDGNGNWKSRLPRSFQTG
jgi:hypothetical protein